MTGEELESAIGKLREFAVAQGMQWVLDEVDEAIALGVPETRTLRQTSRRGVTTYEDVTNPDIPELSGGEQGRRGRRGEEFVRSRPMTPVEQVELLLQAIGKVLTNLDEIANGTMEALDPASLQDYLGETGKTDSLGLPVTPIASMSFVPEGGSTAPAVSIDVLRSSRRRARVGAILSQIEAEISS
jgi:hypothetical protein